MVTAELYNWKGERTGSVDLPSSVFEVEIHPILLQQAVVAQSANARGAIANTKTKGEVRGGGRKPWKQKGTGRARHGSIRSPQWKGGGVIFGPTKDRNFSLKINKKARRRALQMSLSQKARNQAVMVLEELGTLTGKTKELERALTGMKPLVEKKRCLVVIPKKNDLLRRSSKNLPWVETVLANSLNVRDILCAKQLVVLRSALTVMEQTYGHLGDKKKGQS